MPSLADIPDHLLQEDKQHDFISWLRENVSDAPTARALAAKWKLATRSQFSQVEFNRLRDMFGF